MSETDVSGLEFHELLTLNSLVSPIVSTITQLSQQTAYPSPVNIPFFTFVFVSFWVSVSLSPYSKLPAINPRAMTKLRALHFVPRTTPHISRRRPRIQLGNLTRLSSLSPILRRKITGKYIPDPR
ncbi:unnamed protein product [Kuraishia capsulata CBS 1993]|uniref:Uncharacterized protein n=1 Tax=Kuraishia capsulata CBS 1993 TaxID=1382522 RepID=W6MUV4_9ASCO|nr:uncharacterized protein KUCA_T00005559001 [Kuraishia capsulata CBS 1993]CDK29567.1 unnamed protein product [Kuraishia capsulata CBS 1993]